MGFTLTREHRDIAAMVPDLMEEKARPRAQEIDEKAEFPVWVADLFHKLDIFAVVIPEEYGGADGGLVTLCPCRSRSPGGMVAQVEASRALIYAAAGKHDQRAPTRELQTFSALAKLFAGDAAMKVVTDAVQLMAGYGYCAEYGAERFMRDAKVFQIFEGANELHQT